MYEVYRKFIFSDEIKQMFDWIEAVIEDDLALFIESYNPTNHPKHDVLNPIEVAIAYQADTILDYFLRKEDYSHFQNYSRLNLLVICLIFDNLNYLQDALEHWKFDDVQMLEMYAYMIEHGELELFKTFYAEYPIIKKHYSAMLRLAMTNDIMFEYLMTQEEFRDVVYEHSVLYEILALFPQFYHYVESLDDLTRYLDSDVLEAICGFDDVDVTIASIDFLLDRGWDVNAYNSFGFPLVHTLLRFAKDASIVEHFVAKGANIHAKTTLGYPSSHQLLFRDARFTLEVSHLVDMDATDDDGLTLHDYDELQRQEGFKIDDAIRTVKCALNMNEQAIYEFDIDEFYDMCTLLGIDIFQPYILIAKFENEGLKESFVDHHAKARELRMFDVSALEMKIEGLPYEEEKDLYLNTAFPLTEKTLNDLKDYATNTGTKIVVESEGYEVNHTAQYRLDFSERGKVIEKIAINSHLIDAFYAHFFLNIALKDIIYAPILNKNERFLT